MTKDDDDQQNVSSFFSNQLQDGFHEIFTFRGHRLQLRGLKLVEWAEDNRKQAGFYHRQHFLSWDVKQILLWRQDFLDSQSEPQPHPVLIHQVRFSNQPNFICTLVHVPRLKVFLAAALDMSFKIFDKNLVQLESIRHEERAILEMEYDSVKDIIFTSGATGVSAWKLYRNTSLDKAHVMEKLFSFKGCNDWITRMIYEPQFNRIYALKERSAQVLSIPRRSVVTVLEDCHEAPINVVCWYERNQFYITGCSRGEIKCWTSNYNQGDSKRAASPSRGGSGPADGGKVFALLHTFMGHSKAVTGIRLHPISGLAISTGMDGFVKVLNLEALNELFSIKLDTGILSMNIIKMGAHGFGCLMSLADASIKLWKITSVCDFFATSSSKVARMELFENLEAELEHFHRLKHQARHGAPTQLRAANSIVKSEDLAIDAPSQAAEAERKGEEGESTEAEHRKIAGAGEDDDDDEEENGDNCKGGSVADRILCAFSSQDLRCFSNKGVLMGRLEPEHIVDGIKAFTVSVYQKLMFCLCERDRIRVHCLRRFTFPLVHELSLQGDKLKADGGPSSPAKDDKAAATSTNHIKEDVGVCCALIDMAPTNAMRAPKADGNTNVVLSHAGGVVQPFAGHGAPGATGHLFKQDARGQSVPDYIESYLLVGLNTGAILFLDTLNNFEVQLSFQANNGSVQEIKYRRRLRELVVLGKDFSDTFSTVRVWRMPDLELIAEVSELRRVSCFAISMSLSHFAVGTAAGNVKLFTVDGIDKQVREIGQVSENHDSAVSSVTFCDDVRVLCSASQDSRVKFWDLSKRLVRTIHLNLPTCGVIQNGGPGDVLMAQNHYILTIPMRIWDEGGLLAEIKKHADAAEQHSMSSASGGATPRQGQGQGLNMGLASLSTDAPVKTSLRPPKILASLADIVANAVTEKDTKPVSDEPGVDDASRRTGRKPSRRVGKAGGDDLLTVASAAAEARKFDRRKTSLQLFHEAKTAMAQDARSAERDAEELEEKVLLPQLQLQQFQFVSDGYHSRSPSPQFRDLDQPPSLDDVSLTQESAYLRMPTFSTTSSGTRGPDASTEPFVFDTLHPRFLVHRKPAARAAQLEDLEQNLPGYLAKLSALKTLETQKTELLNKYRDLGVKSATAISSSQPQTPDVTIVRRPAQFGLSPRARLTLLNSHPSSTGHLSSSQDSDSLVEAMADVFNTARLARTQESVICNTAIGMKVSNSYRKHRQQINEARHQRSSVHGKRASVSLPEAHRSVMLEELRRTRAAVLEEEGSDDVSLTLSLPPDLDTHSQLSQLSSGRKARGTVVFADDLDDRDLGPGPAPAPARPALRSKPLKPRPQRS